MSFMPGNLQQLTTFAPKGCELCVHCKDDRKLVLAGTSWLIWSSCDVMTISYLTLQPSQQAIGYSSRSLVSDELMLADICCFSLLGPDKSLGVATLLPCCTWLATKSVAEM